MKSAAGLFRDSDSAARSELRMWLFVRDDLPMPLGKFAAQAGHAYSTCLWFSNQHDPSLVATYMESAQGKIAVSVKNEEELLKCVEACKEAGLVAVSIKDAAHTVFEKPTYTVGAVGPCCRKDLPKQVSRLRLFEDWQSVNDR
jgi:peptidyl-tRNA hydrolase